ncbi:hypothetical protein EVAR_30_1 [Eumeta japonica]|uniref:DUF5641 domain-containing protein n=1 Tax=Eumeta variegata TaxID=151549 RepID=A0A4C1S7U6_EUMVA|nr:hypothetical protein EVAR_30_1 [Eumeta japonica]
MPRGLWPRGRIIKTIPGRDNKVRIVDIQTKLGILKRPTSRLSWLRLSSSLQISQIGSRSVENSVFYFHLQVGRTAECLPGNVASYQRIVGWRAFLSLIVSIEVFSLLISDPEAYRNGYWDDLYQIDHPNIRSVPGKSNFTLNPIAVAGATAV